MKNLGIGVIGTGFWGKNHIRVFSNLENVELIAVCDIDHNRVKEVADKYKLHSYSNVEELLMRDDIDAVSLCTPTTTHYKIALKAIEYGKHLFLEKPMVSNTDEAKRILEEVEKKQIQLMVGFIERFNPAVQKVKTLIKDGVLGEVVLAFAKRVGRWPERIGDVGVVKDTAIHDLDIMRFIFEQEPKSVYARMGNLGHTLWDYAQIMLGFNAIQTGFIEANWLTPRKMRILTVTGKEAVITLNYLSQEITIEDYEKQRELPHIWEEPLVLELKEFVQSILEDREPKVTGWDGLKALTIAEAAIKSARLERVVGIDQKTVVNQRN